MFFCLVLLCLCARQFICALWSLAGKELNSWLSFVVSVSFSLSDWYPGSGVVLDCIDSWSLQDKLQIEIDYHRAPDMLLDKLAIYTTSSIAPVNQFIINCIFSETNVYLFFY